MTLKELHNQLKELRGAHDQTIRTRVIELCFPGDSEQTSAQRFLEYMLDEVERSMDLGQGPIVY